jgi:hypothetical protein
VKTFAIILLLCAFAQDAKLSKPEAEALREKLRADYEEKLFKGGIGTIDSAGLPLNFVKIKMQKLTVAFRSQWILAALHPNFGEDSYLSGDLAPRTFEWIKANHQDLMRADVSRICVGNPNQGALFWACFKMNKNIEEVKYKGMQP